MRKLLFVVFLIGLLVASCSKTTLHSTLVDIDSLSNDSPRVALNRLTKMYATMDTSHKADLMYYKLLKYKAQDKSYLFHPNLDEMNEIVEYYEGEHDDDLLALAYYLLGVTYNELQDSPSALIYYHKSLDVLDKKDNLRLRSVVNAQIGYIMYFQDNCEQAKSFFEEAYRIDSLRQDFKGMVYDLRDLGLMNYTLGDSTDALRYFMKALSLAKKSNLPKMQTSINASLASLYLDMEPQKLDSIKKYFLPILNDIRPENQSGIFSQAVKYYLLVNQQDSVNFYLAKIDRYGTVYSKKFAEKIRLDHALDGMNTAQQVQIWQKYLLYNDSIEKITESEAVSKSQALYDYSLKVKENHKLKSEQLQRDVFIIVVLLAFLFSVVLFLVYYRHVKREKMEKNRQLEELNRVLDEMKVKPRLNQEPLALLKETEIYHIFLEKLENHVNLSPLDWQKMDEAVHKYFKDFKITLYRLYTINEHEYHICILVKLHFSVNAIASLLHRGPSSITMSRKRLCKKFFKTEENAEKFDAFIDSI